MDLKRLSRLSYFATSNNVNQIINILDQIIIDLQSELVALNNFSLYIGADVNQFPTSGVTSGRLGIDTRTKKLYSFDGVMWNQVVEPCQSPMNVINPTISGTTTTGNTLTVTDNGTWIGDLPITYTYQWLRNGVDIIGEVNSTYLLTVSDIGTNIRCRVTATNACGFADATSNGLGPIVGSALLDTYATNTAYGWSVARKLKSSAIVAIRIRRSNDNSERDIGFDVNGNLDTNAITTFVGGNSAFITRLLEQNGSGYDFIQTTAANQFRIVNAGTLEQLNTKPTANCNHSPSAKMTIPSSTGYFLFMRNGTLSSLFAVYKKGITTTTAKPFISTTNSGAGGTGTGFGVINWTDGKTYIQSWHSGGNYNYNGTPGTTPDAQMLISFYVDADNATPANRTTGYLNGGTAVNDNIWNYNVYSGSNSNDYFLGNGNTASTPIDRFQELILLPSQSTLSTFRNNINEYYNIYTIPVNTVAPVISGTPNVGYMLLSSTGTWSDGNTPPITYSYQWKRNGSNIIGATSSAYTMVNADLGTTITCTVTATNSIGNNSANSSNSIVPNASVAPLLDSYSTNTAYGWSIASRLKNTATNAIRVRRSNDNAETDIGFVENQLDTATLLSFTGSNSAFITRIYEQVGSGYDFTQTTASRQPRIVNAGVLQTTNGKPCAKKMNAFSPMVSLSPTSAFLFLINGTTSSIFSVYRPTDNNSSLFSTTSSGVSQGMLVRASTSDIMILAINSSGSQIISVNASFSATSQKLLSIYFDADNATAAERAAVYFNNNAAIKSNTRTNVYSSGNNNIALTLGGFDDQMVEEFQELIILPSQPTLSTFRNDINGRYAIY